MNPLVTRHVLCLALRAIGSADVRLRHPAYVVDKLVWNNKNNRKRAPKRTVRMVSSQDGPNNPRGPYAASHPVEAPD